MKPLLTSHLEIVAGRGSERRASADVQLATAIRYLSQIKETLAKPRRPEASTYFAFGNRRGTREQKANVPGRSDHDGDGGTSKHVQGHERRLRGCAKREQKANVPGRSDGDDD